MDFGSYAWFIGLGLGILVLGGAIAYGASGRRKRGGGGDPNRTWKQEAAESGHPEVADPNARPPR